jgi:hypothetical protein
MANVPRVSRPPGSAHAMLAAVISPHRKAIEYHFMCEPILVVQFRGRGNDRSADTARLPFIIVN